MKTMKLVCMFVLASVLAVTMNSCKKCKNEDPRARIINNGTETAGVQIKTSNGNTVNINNVEPGTSSVYNSYAAGQVTFTLRVNSVDYPIIVDMDECFEYDIIMDANNNLTSKPIDRNE